MSRSAADATRFTATGPYASSKPGNAPYKLPGHMSNSASSSQPQGPGGNPETPKEKVERLRAQARAARMAQSTSRVDQVVDVGRRFANKAHKVMVYSLITASGRFLCYPQCILRAPPLLSPPRRLLPGGRRSLTSNL